MGKMQPVKRVALGLKKVEKKKGGNGGNRRSKSLGKTRMAAASMELPTAVTKPSNDIRDYSILFYTPPKFGKTTFFSTFPDILFLPTEPGTRGLRVMQFVDPTAGCITHWEQMLRAVDLLEKEKSRFENVVIDTACEAYRLASEYVCNARGIKHPSDANDYGATWGAVADEFVGVFKRIQQTGRGAYMTAHDQSKEIEMANGTKHTKIGPNITGKAGARVLALADFIFYGDYMQDVKGQNRRVVMTQGSELVNCGARKISGAVNLPAYIPLPDDESQDYDTFARAFRGEDVGMEPTELFANASTSKAGTRKVAKDRLDAKMKGR